MTSPYAEGASITLTCTATGGKPLPRITWWRDGDLVSEDTQHFPERKKAVGVLKILKLKRSHLLAVYSCEVSNNRVQPPLVVRVAIDMYLRPLEVNLVGENKDLSAGRKHNITCRSKGSRPPAIITWWKVWLSVLLTSEQAFPTLKMHPIQIQYAMDNWMAFYLMQEHAYLVQNSGSFILKQPLQFPGLNLPLNLCLSHL